MARLTTRTVTTQAELDAAIAEGVPDIIINSPRGVWIDVIGSATVTASGSVTVTASNPYLADLLAKLDLPADALDTDPGLDDCENCGGPGVIHDDNGHAIACPTCDGTGIVERRPS